METLKTAPKKTLCGNPETTCNHTPVDTIKRLDPPAHSGKPRNPDQTKKLKWFRHQPYIHFIYRHSILVAEDTSVSPHSRSHVGWKHRKPTRRLSCDLISLFQTQFHPGIIKSIPGFNSQSIGIQYAILSKYCDTKRSNMASPLEPRPIPLYSYSALILYHCLSARPSS